MSKKSKLFEAADNTTEAEVRERTTLLETSEDEIKYEPNAITERILERIDKIKTGNAELDKALQDAADKLDTHVHGLNRYSDGSEKSRDAYHKLEQDDPEKLQEVFGTYKTMVTDHLLIVEKLLDQTETNPQGAALAVELITAATEDRRGKEDDTRKRLKYFGITQGLPPGGEDQVVELLNKISDGRIESFANYLETSGFDSITVENAANAHRENLGKIISLSERFLEPRDYDDIFSTTTKIKTKIKVEKTSAEAHTDETLSNLTVEQIRERITKQWDAENQDGNNLVDTTSGPKLIERTFLGGEKLRQPRQFAQVFERYVTTKDKDDITRYDRVDVPVITLYAERQLSAFTKSEKIYSNRKDPVVRIPVLNFDPKDFDEIAFMNEMLKMARNNPDGSFDVFVANDSGKAETFRVNADTYNAMRYVVQRSVESHAKKGITYNPEEILKKGLKKLTPTETTSEEEIEIETETITTEGQGPEEWVNHKRALARMKSLRSVAGQKLGFTEEEMAQTEESLTNLERIYTEFTSHIGRVESYYHIAQQRLKTLSGVSKGHPRYEEGLEIYLQNYVLELGEMSVTLKNAYNNLMNQMTLLESYSDLPEAEKITIRNQILTLLSSIDKMVLEQNPNWRGAIGETKSPDVTTPSTIEPEDSTSPAITTEADIKNAEDTTTAEQPESETEAETLPLTQDAEEATVVIEPIAQGTEEEIQEPAIEAVDTIVEQDPESVDEAEAQELTPKTRKATKRKGRNTRKEANRQRRQAQREEAY